MTKLSDREEMFCRMYVTCRNAGEAAFKAGYTAHPELTAVMLMAKKTVRKRIERMEKDSVSCNGEVAAGLRRLAFSSSADAVRLLLTDSAEALNPDELDLFNVSEIKRAKGGGIEIKFFDRIKALEKLGEITQQNARDSAVPFYEALENGAAALGGGDDR